MYSHLHVDATFGFAPYSITEFWHYSPFIAENTTATTSST
jgi:hypothetical protein